MTSKDDDLVEKMAAAWPGAAFAPFEECLRVVIALARPIIERETLEKAAKALADDYAYAAADIVRALIPRDEEGKP